jgi:hypothetical protein
MQFDPKQPLWLPAGSGRLIIALAIVGAVIVQAPPEAIVRLGEIVVTAYFVSKAAASAATK